MTTLAWSRVGVLHLRVLRRCSRNLCSTTVVPPSERDLWCLKVEWHAHGCNSNKSPELENVAKLSDHAKRTYYAIQKLPDSDAFLKNLLCEDEIAHANHKTLPHALKLIGLFSSVAVATSGVVYFLDEKVKKKSDDQ